MNLEVTPKKSTKQEGEQAVFEKLMSQLDKLRNEKDIAYEKLVKLAAAYDSKIPKMQREFAATQVAIARQLAASVANLDLNRKQMAQVEELIVYFCEVAFSIEPPDAELIAFFDNWSDSTYAELHETENELELEMIAAFARAKFDIEVDVSDLDASPESHAILKERIRIEMEKKEAEEAQKSAGKKKSEKRLQKEATQRNQAAAELKNIRSIYISLAKMLHPDKATSEADRKEKEAWMKKVTIAYTARDLATLLKLETQWVTSQKDGWKELSADKLKAYISTLKTQVKDLKAEISVLHTDPRFGQVADVAHLDENYALQKINKKEKAIKSWIKDFEGIKTYLQQHKGKAHVVSCVQQILNSLPSY